MFVLGVGIILITVSGIAWRLTSSGPTWRSILGLHELHPPQSLCNGSSINDTARRFVPRVPAPYGRTGTHHHPYGAMFYPEFQYRPPPPSYQASMQEYRLRLLLLDRSSHPQSTSLSPVSPPPTYRSSAASSLTGKTRSDDNVWQMILMALTGITNIYGRHSILVPNSLIATNKQPIRVIVH